MRVQVTSVGMFAPPRVETSAELAPRVGKTEDWIVGRTGVSERRISDRPMSELAAEACREALGDGPEPDLIVNASLTPIQLIPDSSIFIQRELGLRAGIPSFSVHATCLSFIVALHNVAALVASGAYRRVLVVSAEQGSVCRDFDHPESAVLIGDGAAAVVVEPTAAGGESQVLAYAMRTWPDGAELAELRGCGTRKHPNDPETQPADNLFRMRGPAIYRRAYRGVDRLLTSLWDQAGLAPGDVDLVVPHQASGPALALLPRMGLPADRVVNIVSEYGNCIAASTPMALAHAVQSGRLERGNTVLFIGTGAGLSAAGLLMRW